MKANNPKLISIIAAVSENGVIGFQNKMPWSLKSDLKRFKSLTTGHTVIMGRKTFETIGKPLQDRKNIVISTTLSEAPEGCVLARTFNEALELAKSDRVFIIGGSKVFEVALQIANRLCITTVHTSPVGDTFFPEVDYSKWVMVESEEILNSDIDEFDTTFRVWEKK